MIKAYPITADHLAGLKPLYQRFASQAKTQYGWQYDPVPWEDFQATLAQGHLHGCWAEETTQAEPIALLLYRLESHGAIEINLIYSEIAEHKIVLDRLMIQFLNDIREKPGWEVVSYAMLGVQGQFVRTLPWYGFRLVGQAIASFDVMDPVCVQILKQQTLALPEGAYAIEAWTSDYAEGVADCIVSAFSKASDALWDPRFKTLPGAQQVIHLLTQNILGHFLPQCTQVALFEGRPVGFCFLLQDDVMLGHIPLIGVHADFSGKGLGTLLLQRCLNQNIEEVLAGRGSILKISTTMDTDNIPSIKMYRRLGFREESNYPHAYLTRDKALAFRPGKWC